MTAARVAAPARRARPSLRAVSGVVISVVALAAVVWWASRQDAPSFPSKPGDIALVVAAIGLYGVATLVRGWRWHVILRLDGIDHRARDALGIVCVGYMGNTVLPARGGEVLRVVLLKQRSPGARKREILGSIIAERALDAVVLIALFAMLTFVGVAGSPTGIVPAIVGTAALVLLGVGLYTYLRMRRAGRLEGFAAKVRPLVKASRPLLGPVGATLALATAGVWCLEAAIFVLVADSLNIGLSLIEGLSVNVLASFFSLVPAAPGYVGTLDAAILFGLKALDITGGAAVSFALLVRFVLFVPITVAGLLLVLTRYGGIAALRRARDAPEAET